jgi:hypothetical protein
VDAEEKLGHAYYRAGSMVKTGLMKKVFSKSARFLAVLVLMIQISCGIFSPRPSETPETSGRTDPLNFAAIMYGTSSAFTKLRYEDLFLDNPDVYFDFNSGLFSKSRLIQKLQQIQILDTLIQVQWKTGEVWKNSGNDTMRLTGLKYYIFPDGNTSGTPADSGGSNFTVIYDGDWFISQWTDVPARTTGSSFFAPATQ